MENNSDTNFIAAFSCLFGMLLLALMWNVLGMSASDYRERFEKEAIAMGHATYIVDTNSFSPNTPKFKWNSEK